MPIPGPKPQPNPTAISEPFWTTADGLHVQLWLGDVVDVLRKLPAQSVQCVVTSPPYWGLRDYGTGEWIGGSADCDHIQVAKFGVRTGLAKAANQVDGGNRLQDNRADETQLNLQFKETCGKCGARRIDRQIGSEETPDAFVAKMVEVFREVRRVLHDTGTLWINLGDSYSSGISSSGGKGTRQNQDHRSAVVHKEGYKSPFLGTATDGSPYLEQGQMTGGSSGLPAGNLVGIPWRVALALQADGWILRQDIVWHKKSPMPESVTNRCTKSHEYIFLLTKQREYFYDAEAIKEQSATADLPPRKLGNKQAETEFDGMISHNEDHASAVLGRVALRNKRSVWTLASVGYEGAHFACFPPKLIEPCILAGTSEKCCTKCSTPWKRVTEEKQIKRDRPNEYVKRTGEDGTGNSCANSVAGVETKTIGWQPGCECHGHFVSRRVEVTGQAVVDESNIPNGWAVGDVSHDPSDYARDGVAVENKEEQRQRAKALGDKVRIVTVWDYVSDLPLSDHPVVPCVVLDPFIGSGTTCCVSLAHGRRSIGIDLSETYLRCNAIPRIEGELLTRPDLAALAGRKIEKVVIGRKVSR